jgi:hypothetical protein
MANNDWVDQLRLSPSEGPSSSDGVPTESNAVAPERDNVAEILERQRAEEFLRSDTAAKIRADEERDRRADAALQRAERRAAHQHQLWLNEQTICDQQTLVLAENAEAALSHYERQALTKRCLGFAVGASAAMLFAYAIFGEKR